MRFCYALFRAVWNPTLLLIVKFKAANQGCDGKHSGVIGLGHVRWMSCGYDAMLFAYAIPANAYG